MTTAVATRFSRVAAAFTARVEGVPDGGWERPSPCEGWAARDVVRHLVEWVPAFLATGTGSELPAGPSPDDDPAGAWAHLRDHVQRLLDDPTSAASSFSHPMAGSHRLDDAIARFVLGDVLVHTWDLARATGQDERLDADEVRAMLQGIEPMGDALSKSGHYGVPVPVAGDADEQARLLACTGRTP